VYIYTHTHTIQAVEQSRAEVMLTEGQLGVGDMSHMIGDMSHMIGDMSHMNQSCQSKRSRITYEEVKSYVNAMSDVTLKSYSQRGAADRR